MNNTCIFCNSTLTTEYHSHFSEETIQKLREYSLCHICYFWEYLDLEKSLSEIETQIETNYYKTMEEA